MNRTASATIEDRVFRALADPTRRALLASLHEGRHSVRDLTSKFDMTQSAISQHLRVLRDAAMVSERKAGRLRLYELRPEPLRIVQEWLDQHTDFWTSRLERLGDHLRKSHGENA